MNRLKATKDKEMAIRKTKIALEIENLLFKVIYFKGLQVAFNVYFPFLFYWSSKAYSYSTSTTNEHLFRLVSPGYLIFALYYLCLELLRT